MLGQAVFRLLSASGWNVTGTQYVDPSAPWYFDATAEPEHWRRVIVASGCDYIVNCIGILKAAVLERDADSLRRAIRVNALFPYELAAAAADHGARLIQISTDGVFRGRPEAYYEDDPPDAADHYGRTKALGECPAQNALHVRCSIVGRDAIERKGLLEWFLRQPEGSEVNGYSDSLWNGVTTVQFARLCEAVIRSGAFDRIRAVSHVHHFCPNPVTTKYDLLCAWQQVTGRKVTVRATASPEPASRVLATRYYCLPDLHAQGAGWCEILSELQQT